MNALNVLLVGVLVISAVMVSALLMTVLQLGLYYLYLLLTRRKEPMIPKVTSVLSAGKSRTGVIHLTEEHERKLAETLNSGADKEVG